MTTTLVHKGQRSSLYRNDDGSLQRLYHDTMQWSVVPVRFDYRGARRPPPSPQTRSSQHLTRAREILLTSNDIQEVARRCGVKRTTAWNYVTRLCEESTVAMHVLTSGRFVCPELEKATEAVDLSGSLRVVMERIEEVLRGNVEWRCQDDRYSQLRLLRVCLTSLNE